MNLTLRPNRSGGYTKQSQHDKKDNLETHPKILSAQPVLTKCVYDYTPKPCVISSIHVKFRL